ncbi:MAG: acyl-CoA dehydrogenase family protein [Pseudomonadota bacterium]
MAELTFTDEQSMLLETAQQFCVDNSPMATVRSLIDSEDGFDRDLWQQMAELGWLGINIPEALGGLGMGLGDVVPVVEAMGKTLLASPYVSTVTAAQVLMTNGSDAQKQAWGPKIASGAIATMAVTEEDGDWNLSRIEATGTPSGDTLILSGRKCFVQDGGVADVLLLTALVNSEPRIVLLTRDQIPPDALESEVVIDATRRSWQLNLDGLTVPADALLPGADLQAIEHTAMLLLCAEMAGGISGVLDVVVDYLTTRTQFGSHIGGYQSLKHPSVQILLGLEGARSHLYHAASAVNAGTEDCEEAIRMAKAQASEAFAFAGDRAIQFHGGFGFTWECDAQLYLRRAVWCQYQYGDERHQRQLLAPLLLDKAG